MKTILWFLTVPLIAFAQTAHPDLKWVDDEIAAIKPPRKGLSASAVTALKDPFSAQLFLNRPPAKEGEIAATVPPEPEMRPFTLQAIFNGKSAMIDGKWYQQDEEVHGYTLEKIDQNAVLLQKKKKKLRLSLIVPNDQIKINVQ